MTGVKDCQSASRRTPAGIDAVGTNALLTKGRMTRSNATLFAPADV
jgi:hypothetical protein